MSHYGKGADEAPSMNDMHSDTRCYQCGEVGSLEYEGGGYHCVECGHVQEESSVRPAVNVQNVDGKARQVGTMVGLDAAPRLSHPNKPKSIPSAPDKAQSKKRVADLVQKTMSRLLLPLDMVREVTAIMERFTDGKWGSGRHVNLQVGACIYAICRKHRKPLTLMDVSDQMSCSVFKLGKVYNRLVQTLDLRFGAVDPKLFVERILAGLALKKGGRQLLSKLRRQAEDILDIGRRDWLLIGRIPSAAAGAAVLLALRANHIRHPVEDIASRLHIANRTVKQREREFTAAMMSLASPLPWGKSISAKTFDQHLPFIVDNIKMLIDMQTHGEERRAREKAKAGGRDEDPAVALAAGAAASSSGPAASSSSSSAAAAAAAAAKPAEPLTAATMPTNNHDPPAFRRSVQARAERMVRVKKALARIKEHSKGQISIKHKLDLSRVAADRSPLDREDLLVQRLLMRGVDVETILSGTYDSLTSAPRGLTAAQVERLIAPDIGPRDMPEDELDSYMRSPEEVALLQSLRSQADLDLPEQPKKRARAGSGKEGDDGAASGSKRARKGGDGADDEDDEEDDEDTEDDEEALARQKAAGADSDDEDGGRGPAGAAAGGGGGGGDDDDFMSPAARAARKSSRGRSSYDDYDD